jgi:predicted AAA+ superfamily ATPase
MTQHIYRTLTRIVTETSDRFRVLLLTGPRQVGG